MQRSPQPFCALPWTPDLATALAQTSAAIARLDARVYASSAAPAWRLRAAWTGYARALQLQRIEIDEIDIYARQCGVHLAERGRIVTTAEPFAALPDWQAQLVELQGRHWREDLPFTFAVPATWGEAPALVRALDLTDAWCRQDTSIAPWLARPIMLARLKLTLAPLPCLAGGDEAQRSAMDTRPALLKRLLKQLRKSADDGLARLEALERLIERAVAVLAAEHRPGQLGALLRISLAQPSLAARTVAGELGLTLSGAGKLLTRATRLGLLVEIGARQSWRAYVTADLAVVLGVKPPDQGRPRGLPQPARPIAAILGQFDTEMAAIDLRLQRLGISHEPGDIDDDVEFKPVFEVDEEWS